jgi:hypothetical protein
MHLSTKLVALVTGAALIPCAALVATAGTADAAPPPKLDLRGASMGSFELDPDGSARLAGTVTGTPFDGAYTATLAAADGSLPEPGHCEPATATLEVTGPKGRHLGLAATGEVCGEWADATYVVTHRFVGRYDVAVAPTGRLRGTDGWISLILATGGRANVEAIDT